MYTKCPKCGAVMVDPGQPFMCPNCGTQMQTRADFFEVVEEREPVPPSMQYGEMTPFRAFKAIVSGACLVAMMTFLLILFIEVLVYIYGIFEVGAHWQELRAIPFIIIPYPVGLVLLEGYGALAYWTFIVLFMAFALVWMIWPERKKLKDTMLDSLPKVRSPSRSNDTTLFIVTQMFFAILFFDYAYYWLIESSGNSPSTPAFEENKPWENLYGFLNASVWEELAARVLLIGVPLVLIVIFMSMGEGTFDAKIADRKKALRRALRLLWGGHNEFKPITVGLIVFSSLMFGFAHAPGWDLWKVLPTALSGLGFGYIYVRKGVHGAMILHFTFDYLGMAQDAMPASLSVELALVLIILLWVVAGFVYFVFYTAKVVRFFAEPDEKWPRPEFGSSGRNLWELLGWK